MSIAPITGRLRKRLWADLTVALGLGIAGGYAYWYGIHLQSIRRKEQFYVKMERERQEADN